MLWLSGRALAAQARGVLSSTAGFFTFLYFRLITLKFIYQSDLNIHFIFWRTRDGPAQSTSLASSSIDIIISIIKFGKINSIQHSKATEIHCTYLSIYVLQNVYITPCIFCYLDNRIGGAISQTTHILPSFNPEISEGTKTLHTVIKTAPWTKLLQSIFDHIAKTSFL